MQRRFLDEGLLLSPKTKAEDYNQRIVEQALKLTKVQWTEGNMVRSEGGVWTYGRTIGTPGSHSAGDKNNVENNEGKPHTRGIIPPSQRLAAVFLHKLGRETPGSSSTTENDGTVLQTRRLPIDPSELVPLVPRPVLLLEGSLAGSGKQSISLSARDIDEYAEKQHQIVTSSCSRKEGDEENCELPPPPPPLAKAASLYGRDVFVMSQEEVCQLLSTRRIVTSEFLPKSFFIAINFLFSSPEWAHYLYVHQSIPLKRFGTRDTSADQVLAESFALLNALQLSDVAHEEPAHEDDNKGEALSLQRATTLRWQWILRELRAKKLYRTSLEKFETEKRLEFLVPTLIDAVQQTEDCSGFSPRTVKSDIEKTVALSPVELAENVSVSMKTYFFVNGTQRHIENRVLCNQLAERAGEPVAVIFGKLVDFSTLEEVSKLLSPSTAKQVPTDHQHQQQQRSSLKKSAEGMLFSKFHRIFTLMLRSAQLQGVKTLVFQPMVDTTTSPYLSQVDSDGLSTIVSLHFQAFYEVLQEDWGLEHCYLCGGRYHSWAITALNSTNGNEGKAYETACHLVIEEKDPKHLAISLSRLRQRVGLCCPADYWTLLCGRIGGHWEAEDLSTSPGAHNPMLADVVATSLLPTVTDSLRARGWCLEEVCDDSDITGINKWVDVALPLGFDALSEGRDQQW